MLSAPPAVDEVPKTASTNPDLSASRTSTDSQVLKHNAKTYQKDWYATGGENKKVSGEELRKLWSFSARALQARSELKTRELALSEKLLKERRSGWTSTLLTTYATRYQWAFFVVVHLVITLLIWSHFFLKKFRQQEGVPEFIPAKAAVVPEDAGLPMPNYWKKRLVPPLEFGLMHAILWQMVWLPVTMSRHLLALAARTRIRNFVPLEHMTFFHISLGYIMCFFIVVATIVFFIFFGHGCRQHLGQLGHPLEPIDFCENMQSEIMITGLCIFVLLVIVLTSSFLRRHMPFEWFYVLHHLVFVMFGLAIAHTLDDQFREGTLVGKARSQNFRFVATTLILYFMDRAWSFLQTQRNVPVESALVTSAKSMILLMCRKPAGFQFSSGQYAYLQIPSVDITFHPFSIGSAPEENVLRFYIVVYKGQWTEKLADALQAGDKVKGVNIMGPFGPGFDTNNFVSVGAVGTGTGIVPMMSLMRERYHRLTLMNKELLREIKEDPEKVTRLEHTTLHEATEHLRLITIQYWWKLRCMKVKGTETAVGVSKATNHVYYHYLFDMVAHAFLILDMCQGFWTFSWKYLNEMEFKAKFPKVDQGQWQALEVMSLVSILFFLVHRLYVWANPRKFARSFADVLDAMALAFMFGTHFAWTGEDTSFYVAPSQMAVILRGSFALWRIARIYYASQILRTGDASSPVGAEHDLIKNGKFRALWICRGGEGFAAKCMEFEEMLRDLGHKFTTKQLDELFGLDVYLTGVTPTEEERLRTLIRGSAVERCVRFGRPDVVEWVVRRMSDVLRDTLHNNCAATGGSLIAYCGSPAVGSQVSQGVQEANMHASVLRMEGCRMTFQEEYYGIVGGKPKKKRAKDVSGAGSAPKSDAE